MRHGKRRTVNRIRRLVPVLTVAAALLLPPQPAAAQSADTEHAFDIAAQPLTSALLEFARQARVSIGFPDELTDGIHSTGVRGTLSRREALERLLAGSELTWSLYGRDAVRIRRDTPAAEPGSQPDAEIAGQSVLPPAADTLPIPGNAAALPQRIEEIVTIGTQIHAASIADMLPVTVLDGTRLEVVGATSAGDLFRSLPAAGIVNFNGIDNYFYGVNDARGDVASVNLRELGSGNTLMLLNGRRMVLHPGVQAEGRVLATTINSNTLPLGAIERIEVLRDGASSLYGSEAVGGVVDTVLRNDVRGLHVEARHGLAEGSALAESVLDLHTGASLGGRGSLSLFLSYLRRNGMPASDRAWSRSSDLRPLFAGTAFADDADMNNTAASSAWGQFRLQQPVSQNGQQLTTANGLFHIQPDTFPGCRTNLPNGNCIDDATIDDALRSDNNAYRYLSPDLARANVFLMLDLAVNDDVELFGELGWYDARSEHTREPANPLSSHPITIPADNYWNPFGPLTFADGRTNPNRLPGIDAPAEGLPIVIDTRVLGSFYRVMDAGPRRIVVNNDSLRTLAGVRGRRGAWDWESALLYSSAKTVDTTFNRISSTLFQQALALSTPDAYNPFNGGDPDNPRVGDATPNTESVIAPFLVDISRHNRTSLALADLHLSNAEAFGMPAGPAGIALGMEVRRERFAEDRDPRLDGTIGFTDIVSGASFASDVMQSSATPDSAGSRTTHSLFAELALPLIDEAMQLPLAQRLDLQLALRFERFSDVSNELKPRVALAWRLLPALQLRGAWSQGFRAPNLPQVHAGAVPRLQVVRDWYRCQALLNKGITTSLGDCTGEDVRAVEVITSGSDALAPENNSNSTVGVVLTPWPDGRLTVTADYWRISQQGIVGLFGEANHVALDYLLRLEGGSNPAVTRAPLRPEDIDLFAGSGLAPVGLLNQVSDTYLNLDRRVTRGIDLAAFYDMQTARFGHLRAAVEATHLVAATQAVSPLGQFIADLDEPAIAVVGAGDLLQRNGRPRWRASASIDWQLGRWGGGLLARYVGSVHDTSAIDDVTQEFLRVDDWLAVDVFADYRMQLGDRTDLRLRLGARNAFDREPPLADESLGHFVGLHDSIGRYWYFALAAGFGS